MLRKVLAVSMFLLVAGTASATITTSTFEATGNSSGGVPIHAKAEFAFNNLTLTLTLKLTNLLANPGSVAQNITDFDFQLVNSVGQNITPGCNATAGPTNCLTGATAPSTVSVASGGSFVVNNTAVDPQWAFTLNSGVFLLNGLGGANNPAYSIIGPPGGSTYSAAGGSIAGNGPHNPFINQTATWTFKLQNSALTGTSINIAHVVFSFNTVGGDIFTCDTSGCGGGGGQDTPEPVSLLLTGTGLIGMYFIRRRRPGSP